MTTRLKGFVVTLEHDIREDDAEQVLRALSMVRGVVGVKPIVSDPGDMIIRSRVTAEIYQKIFEVFREK
jgi:hypothetical protein